MPTIHPTAIVDPKAELATDVVVGPHCLIGPKVTLGAGTTVRSHTVIEGRSTFGERNEIWPFCTLGAKPQDLKYRGEDSVLIVGDDNEIRENVSINLGTANDNGETLVGSNNLIMAYAHVAHDCIVGDHVVITNAVQLAGHVKVCDGAALGGASAVHHFVTVGEGAFVAGMTRVVHDVPPYMTVEGNPARVRGVNFIGARRRGVEDQSIERLKTAYRTLFRPQHEASAVGETESALAELDAACPNDPYIQRLIESVRRAGQGVHGRHREALRTDDKFHNPAR